MAYANTKKGNNSAPKTSSGGTITFYACLDYTITTTATQVKLAWRARLESSGKPSTKGHITGTGQTKVSFSTKTPSSSGAGLTMGSGTWTWDKAISATNKIVTLVLGPTSTATDYEDALSTAVITVSVPALASYNIAYSNNGGSGSMSSQTKYYGKTLTLRSNTFTRTGYTFQKYNTASGGTGTSYSSGGSYTANAAATMYAQWKANTYTVSFNANGGSGAPASQTKTYDTSLTLTTAKPTRTNYVFKNWNTNSGGTGTSYASGGTFSTNITSNTTLYAQWYAPYTISYDANGGSGAPASQTKIHDTNLTLSMTIPTRAGYTFAGWNSSSASASTVTYAAGATYTANSAATMHAIWKPVITATLALSDRCSDSACTVEDENGTYVKASVTWSCPVSVTASSLSVKSDSGLTIGAYTFSEGTTGSYEAVISGFNSEKSYPITASFETASGSGYMAGSVSVAKVSSGTVYMLDFKGKSHAGILGSADDGGNVGLAIYTPVVELRGPGDDGIDSFFHAKNLRTGAGCSMGVGAGGVNHGLWSDTLSKWLIYGNDSAVFVDGTDMTTSSSNSASAILTANNTTANISGAWVKKWGRVVMVSVTWTNKADVSVPASGNFTDFNVCTLKEGYRPAYAHPGHSYGDNAGAAWYYVGTNGDVQLCACEGTGTARAIKSGTTFNFHAIFLTP